MNAENGCFDLEKLSRYQPKFSKPQESRKKHKKHTNWDKNKQKGDKMLTLEKSGKEIILVSTRGTTLTKKSSPEKDPKSKIIPLDCRKYKFE